MSFICFKEMNFRDMGCCPPLRIQLKQSVSEALQILFSHLSYTSLRQCMLVSKSWRKLALEELQIRCFVKISSEEHVNIVLQQLQGCSNFRVGKCAVMCTSISVDNPLLQVMISRVGHTLNFLKLENADELDEILLFEMLRHLPHLTHLSVTFFGSSSTDNDFRHSESDTDDMEENPDRFKFPFLSGRCKSSVAKAHEKAAQVCIHTVENSDACNNVEEYGNVLHLHLDLGSSITLQLSKVLQVFPNLVELAIANLVDEPRKHFKIRGPHESPRSHELRKLCLRHLSLRQYSAQSFSEKLCQTLIRLDLHLESLVLILHPPGKWLQDAGPFLRLFVDSQGRSLKSLKIAQVEDDLCYFWYHNNNRSNDRHVFYRSSLGTSTTSSTSYAYWNFNYSSPSISLLPKALPHLQVLHIQKPLITNLAQVLHHFPSLTELSLQVSCGSNWKGMLPSKLGSHEGISRLRIDFIDSDSLLRLGHCFPALQTLQLSYCDKSLFDVLCEMIPYFNGGSNLVSCYQCHGAHEEFSIVRRKDDTLSFRKPGQGAALDGFNCVSVSNNGNKGDLPLQHSTIEEGQTHSESPKSNVELPVQYQMRKKPKLKNLSLLTVRTCHHLPFEKFVFLQCVHESRKSSLTWSEGAKFGGTLGGESRRIGFSWSDSEALKDEFVDLPWDSADSESCSSA